MKQIHLVELMMPLRITSTKLQNKILINKRNYKITRLKCTSTLVELKILIVFHYLCKLKSYSEKF